MLLFLLLAYLGGVKATSGCTDPLYTEYNADANTDDGTCSTLIVLGCTIVLASNYNPDATVNNNACVYTIFGCTNAAASNYDSTATTDDGSCIIPGCTYRAANNYDSAATTDDGSCIIPEWDNADALAIRHAELMVRKVDAACATDSQ